MEKYDYRKAIIKDIKAYIKDNSESAMDPTKEDDIQEHWYDILWAEDCITGNGSFWYAPEDICEEFLTHNIDLALEACNEFGVDMRSLFSAAANGNAARYIDCTIRCYLLGECLDQALEELN